LRNASTIAERLHKRVVELLKVLQAIARCTELLEDLAAQANLDERLRVIDVHFAWRSVFVGIKRFLAPLWRRLDAMDALDMREKSQKTNRLTPFFFLVVG
jgi:hypothetical protein